MPGSVSALCLFGEREITPKRSLSNIKEEQLKQNGKRFIQKGRKYCDNSHTEGTNVLLFPDVWNTENKPLTLFFHSLQNGTLRRKHEAMHYSLVNPAILFPVGCGFAD